MKITNVRVYPAANAGTLRAYADITLDNCLSIKEIRLLNSYGRYTLCMPKAVQKDGRSETLAYSSDHQTLKVIEDAVIAEYKKVTGASSRRRRRVWMPN
jgi:stage V sporulation protein G